MEAKKKLALGDLAVVDFSNDGIQFVGLHTFTFTNSKLQITQPNPAITAQELNGCVVEVLEHLNGIPWCCITHLGLLACINNNKLTKIS